ncbi:MAG: hypothetical protein JWN95_2915 [Frankiales bacterium]|nr:hypothetical protein [Frankiales bacterium]
MSGSGGRLVAMVVAIHLATRALTLLAFAAFGRHEHRAFARVVTMWDGNFYANIAARGYPKRLPTSHGIIRPNGAAFFPLFPWSTRPFTALGLPFWSAALVVVTVCSTVAAALIALLVRRYAGDRVGLLTAVCWSAYPLAGVLSAAYSEAMLTMLGAAALLALAHRRWLLAGVIGALAGFTRPTGGIVAVACLVAAIIAIRRDRDWRSLIAVVLSPLGVLAAWAVIGHRARRWDAWFATEKGGWNAHFDGGIDTVRSLIHELSGSATQAFAPLQAVFLILAVIVTVVAIWQRPPASVNAYLIAGFVLAVGTSNVHASIPRFLLPVFPMLVPVARLLDRCPAVVRWTLLSLAAMASAALGGWYFAAGTFAP